MSPSKFFKEVKQEALKVTWPGRRDTFASVGMVLVMVLIFALFFLLVDWIASSAIRELLGI